MSSNVDFPAGSIDTDDLADGAVTGDKIDFSDQYICALAKATGQSVSSGTATVITFPSALSDSRGWHNNSSNTSRVTVDVSGVYRVEGFVSFADSTGGSYRFIYIAVNGSGTTTTKITKDSAGRAAGVAFDTVSLNAGDYVELGVQHDAGATTNTSLHRLVVERIG